MRSALIPPIPDLERFAGSRRFHMLLAQHCDDARYLEFYRARAADAYTILDNGADEQDALNMERVLELACKVGASEIIVPDVQQDDWATLVQGERSFAYLMTSGQQLYEQAGKPRLMIVPQGTNAWEWETCLAGLLTRAERVERLFHIRPPVIGVSKNHDDVVRGGLRTLLAKLPAGYDVHLLGWPRRTIALLELAHEFPWIRSVDSARPFTYGMRGEYISNGLARSLPTEHDYFHTAIPDDRVDFVQDNIRTFDAYSRGVA